MIPPSRLLAIVSTAAAIAIGVAVPRVGAELAARRFEIEPAAGEIVVDGLLDEPAWDGALTFDLPYEWNPGDNVAPPVATDFFVTYSGTHLYAAWRAHDPDPGAIRAHLMDRDDIDTFVQDDHVVLNLDTFNDERRAFQFRVNPLGVQADALFDETGGSEDFAFDMIWQSAARINGEGYVVEIAVPLDQLRFPSTREAMVWGFDVGRSYPRQVRHRIASYPRNRDRSCLLCQIEKVEGFSGLEPGRNLEITPTLTANRTERLVGFPEGDFETDAEEEELGLSVRWGLTPSLTLNAAVNPDFSQVEADVAQLAVNNRFALFFPEKRPFFLQGSDFFQTPIDAVFTRTVVDPDWGLKLTGKEGPNAIGVFVAEDTVNSLIFPSNQRSRGAFLEEDTTTGVLRYRRDVGQSSTVGALFVGREGEEDYSNGVFGVDAFLRLSDVDTLEVQYLRSETRYPSELAAAFGQPAGDFGDDALELEYRRSSRHWNWSAGYRDLGREFRADGGFVPRVDIKRAFVWIDRRFWGDEDDKYTQADVSIFTSRTEDSTGQLTDENVELQASIQGPWQSFLELGVEREKRFFEGVLHEDLDRSYLFARAQPTGALRFSLFALEGETVDFTNNRRADELLLEPSIEAKIGRRFNIQLDHNLQRLDLPEGELFTANLSQLRLVYNLNVRTFVRAIFQRLDLRQNPDLFPVPVEPDEETLFSQLLFSYKVNPQTVFFLGYSDNRLGFDGIPLTQTDRTIFLKIGYAWTM